MYINAIKKSQKLNPTKLKISAFKNQTQLRIPRNKESKSAINIKWVSEILCIFGFLKEKGVWDFVYFLGSWKKRVAVVKMQKKRWRKVAMVRKMLTFAIAAIALVALLYVHIQFPVSEVTKLPDKLPTVHFLNCNF